MQRRGPLCCATAALDTRESSFYVSLPPPLALAETDDGPYLGRLALVSKVFPHADRPSGACRLLKP